MHPSSDHPGFCQQTSGDIPPKLVGASTTIIGSNVYLYGGCQPGTDKVYARMYICDLNTFKWEKVDFAKDNIPQFGRCFHSADVWNDQVVIFGGFGSSNGPQNSAEPCLLNDVQIFDPASRRWLQPRALNGGFTDLVDIPQPRHSHLSAISADRLFIIGGEDPSGNWLDDIFVYELSERAWIQQWHYPRPCGSYLNVASCAEQYVHIPSDGPRGSSASPASLLSPLRSSRSSSPTSPTPSPLSLSSTYLDTRTLPDMPTPSSVSHLPYSTKPTEDFPCEIYIYSNYNSTSVKRKLEVFAPPLSSDFTIRDKSPYLSSTPSPPLLRFPSAGIVGTHLIVAGTYLGPSSQFFSIWALDLLNMTWSHVDTGSEVAYGSWFQGRIWRESNKWVMFGDRNGSIAGDHNQRLSSWGHVAIIDLGVFGVYQPPPLELDLTTQELCLTALEESVETDFEFICEDGQRIRCSRKLVEGRWPWFNSQMIKLIEKAKLALEVLPASAGKSQRCMDGSSAEDKKPDPRITSRSFNMAASHAVTMALLQYFYTLSLLTHLQQSPAVLSQLLVISTTYDIPHLQVLVKHAMHLSLSETNCDEFYEAASRCGSHSLKARAFRYVLSYRQRGAVPLAGQPRGKREQFPRTSSGRSVETVQAVDSPINSASVFPRAESRQVFHDAAFSSQDRVDPVIRVEEDRPQSVQLLANFPSTTDSSEHMPTQPTTSSTPEEPTQQKKQKKSGGILKMLRSTSRPREPEKPKKWKGGGGGRHPVTTSLISRAQKIQAIEASATGVIQHKSSPGSPSPSDGRGTGDGARPASDRTHSSGNIGPSPDSFQVVELPVVTVEEPTVEDAPLSSDRRHRIHAPDAEPSSPRDAVPPPSYFPGPDPYPMSPPHVRQNTKKQTYRTLPTDHDYC